jgi:RNA polymerase sigma-70 factor (ECF subfamily)
LEADLLRGFRRGDRAALERVYRDHFDEVESLVRRGLASFNKLSPANLEDVVQEVFIRAFSDMARAAYDGQRAYGPYVSTIARNVLHDWAKRSGREVPMSDVLEPLLDTDPGGTHAEAADAPGPGSSIDGAHLAVVASYVKGLPDELRAVHHQRFVLAESQRRAAESLGMSRQRLRTLEHKLVKGLRRELRRAGLGDAHPVASLTFSNPSAAVAGSDIRIKGS